MKAVAHNLVGATVPTDRSWASVLSDLFKARLTLLVLITTAVGFRMGVSGSPDRWLMVHAMGGSAFLAMGASALNQLMEREYDALMRRTATRPLPAGLMDPETVLALGVGLSVSGMVWLYFLVNPLTALLGVITLGSYIFVYTPMKRRTVLNTLVGAVPGALPPLMGWTAATGELNRGGWVLFLILFFWQMPHFMAIAWLYREEYARAGFRMLPVIDPEGRRVAATAIRHTIALVAFSLAPFVMGMAGRWYLAGAFILGGGFLAAAINFAVKLTPASARKLFYASIFYLPLLLGLLVFDKFKN
ncbi:MAG: protoheme IX farnesyltransferase [Pedosphaera sp.]|nr:protoheme IX farnesyltransferase [Pedosphaera sp.]